MSSEILKAGVVGVGNMGRNHLRLLSNMKEFDLIGCFDASDETNRTEAENYGITPFSNVEALFETVDVAHIVVPSFLHREYAVTAAEAGCHVLVEKPIALTVEDAEAIIEACSANKVRLCVGHVERFNPAIATLQEIISQEELISVDFRRMSPFYGRVSDASVVEDLMIHDVDVLNAIATSPIKRVVSQGTKVYTDKLDFAQALITYENGLVASLTASRVTEAKIRKAEISTKKCYIDVDYIDRTVEVSGKTSFSLQVGSPVQYEQENTIKKMFVPITEPLRSEFEHFAHCINTDTPVATSGEMGLKALELCLLIQDNALMGEI